MRFSLGLETSLPLHRISDDRNRILQPAHNLEVTFSVKNGTHKLCADLR
jgi:hypothetical protein